MDVKADHDRLGAVRDAMRHAWSGYWTNAKGDHGILALDQPWWRFGVKKRPDRL